MGLYFGAADDTRGTRVGCVRTPEGRTGRGVRCVAKSGRSSDVRAFERTRPRARSNGKRSPARALPRTLARRRRLAERLGRSLMSVLGSWQHTPAGAGPAETSGDQTPLTSRFQNGPNTLHRVRDERRDPGSAESLSYSLALHMSNRLSAEGCLYYQPRGGSRLQHVTRKFIPHRYLYTLPYR